MRVTIAIAGLLLASTLTGSSPAIAGDQSAAAALPEGFHRLRPDLAVGGAASPEALYYLQAAGFKTVLNLRRDSEPGVAEEEKAVQELGIGYVQIPVTLDTLDAATFEAFRKVVKDDSKRPLVVHCTASVRVGMMFAVLAAVDEGKPLDEAEKDGVAAGLRGGEYKAAFRSLAKELIAEKAKK